MPNLFTHFIGILLSTIMKKSRFGFAVYLYFVRDVASQSRWGGKKLSLNDLSLLFEYEFLLSPRNINILGLLTVDGGLRFSLA